MQLMLRTINKSSSFGKFVNHAFVVMYLSTCDFIDHCFVSDFRISMSYTSIYKFIIVNLL